MYRAWLDMVEGMLGISVPSQARGMLRVAFFRR